MLLVFVTRVALQDEAFLYLLALGSDYLHTILPSQALSGSERKIRTKRESLEQLFGKLASSSYSNPNFI